MILPKGAPFTALCRQVSRSSLLGNRVDLHLHTTFSDGTYTPAQVVDLARRSGMTAVAITDHDTCAGLTPAKQAAGISLDIIPGVEISTEFRQQELHLLAYFFNPDDADLQTSLAWLRSERVARFHAMVERLRLQGVPLDVEVNALPQDAALGRRHLAALLVKARRADTIQQAFQRFLGDRGRINVPKRRLPVAEALVRVRQAGGVAAWAHPSYDCTRESLVELRDLGLGAIEVDFPSCRPGRQVELRRLARELNLAVTGGSDCHGPDSPRRILGACGITLEELGWLRGKCKQESV
jgi:predicted metal-dependent phosphoesterase TrpH